MTKDQCIISTLQLSVCQIVVHPRHHHPDISRLRINPFRSLIFYFTLYPSACEIARSALHQKRGVLLILEMLHHAIDRL